MPRVSVIITTCNRARLLQRALDSVAAQTWRDFVRTIARQLRGNMMHGVWRTGPAFYVLFITFDTPMGAGARTKAPTRPRVGGDGL